MFFLNNYLLQIEVITYSIRVKKLPQIRTLAIISTHVKLTFKCHIYVGVRLTSKGLHRAYPFCWSFQLAKHYLETPHHQSETQIVY